MNNILLNDGTLVTIDSNEDIIEVIENNLSYELAQVVSDKMVDIDAEKLYAEERAMTDEDNYIVELEEKESCLHEVLEISEELTTYMENSKRIDKDKIYQKLKNIIEIVNNQI